MWLQLFVDMRGIGKAMTGVALNTLPNVLLIFNICQCLIISLIFGKVGLYVTKNGITSVLCVYVYVYTYIDTYIHTFIHI